jgi:hypothetical protein
MAQDDFRQVVFPRPGGLNQFDDDACFEAWQPCRLGEHVAALPIDWYTCREVSRVSRASFLTGRCPGRCQRFGQMDAGPYLLEQAHRSVPAIGRLDDDVAADRGDAHLLGERVGSFPTRVGAEHFAARPPRSVMPSHRG